VSLDLDEARGAPHLRTPIDKLSSMLQQLARRVPIEPQRQVFSVHAPEQHNRAEAVREDVEILLVRTVFKHHGYTRQFWPNGRWLTKDRHASWWKPAAY
jgi:hypothetical protein